MRIGRLARQIQHSTLALVLAGACPGGALARNRHTHEATAQLQRLTTAQATLLKEAWLGPLSVVDRKSTRLNSSHVAISYAVLCLKKKNTPTRSPPSNSIQ